DQRANDLLIHPFESADQPFEHGAKLGGSRRPQRDRARADRARQLEMGVDAEQAQDGADVAAFSRRISFLENTLDLRSIAHDTPRSALRLVSRFRSSQALAAHSHANFGIKGTLASI